jgi:hypothetical protein
MLPAVPLAYAARHLYSDRNLDAYAPATAHRSRSAARRRRRRTLALVRRPSVRLFWPRTRRPAAGR